MKWTFTYWIYTHTDNTLEYCLFVRYNGKQTGNVWLTQEQFKEWQELWGPERFSHEPQ